MKLSPEELKVYVPADISVTIKGEREDLYKSYGWELLEKEFDLLIPHLTLVITNHRLILFSPSNSKFNFEIFLEDLLSIEPMVKIRLTAGKWVPLLQINKRDNYSP